MAKRACCDYCGGTFDIQKYKYIGKAPGGKYKRITLTFCRNCDLYGVTNSKNKIAEIWPKVYEKTISSAKGFEMKDY